MFPRFFFVHKYGVRKEVKLELGRMYVIDLVLYGIIWKKEV